MVSQYLFPVSAGRSSAGHLSIAGHDVVDLARRYGTPLYLYDAETIRQQVETLRSQLTRRYPGSFEITYAAKAYFSLGFARHLVNLGVGVDVVSLGEMGVAHRAGFAAERVHLHGNNKSPEELAAALEWGVQAIVVDSLEELQFLEDLVGGSNLPAQERIRVWLRISPGVSVDTHAYMQTAHHATKFGLPVVDGQAAEAIRRAQASRRLHLSGLHTHLGSNFFDPEPYRSAIASLMALAEENGYIPEELSPGGGWGVPYLPDQPENPPDAWLQTVCTAIEEECSRRSWPLPKLIVEPGRWLVARSGLVVYSVGTSKVSGDGTHFVAVDGGLADNPRPALYESRYTAVLANRPDEPATQKVCVAGKFCESGDLLIPEVMLPEVRRGDFLVMPAAGAYHLSMSSNYNLAARPAVLWLEQGKIEVLQQRERPEVKGWWVNA